MPDINAAELATDEAVRSPAPVMALRDVVLFPFTIVPLSVGRRRRAAVDGRWPPTAHHLVTQRGQHQAPTGDDLFLVGCVA
jgi:ATP-dependent Lon protease